MTQTKFDFMKNLNDGKIIKFQQNETLISHIESFWGIVPLKSQKIRLTRKRQWNLILQSFPSNFTRKRKISKAISNKSRSSSRKVENVECDLCEKELIVFQTWKCFAKQKGLN